MRIAVLLLFLSACSLIDAFTGQEGPFKTFEHARLPNNRSAEVITVLGRQMVASGGPDVTFMQRNNNGFDFGNLIPMPDNRRPKTMAIAGSPHVVALSDQGIDVIGVNGTIEFCPLPGGSKLELGDLDDDGAQDIVVLQEQANRVTVFFSAGLGNTLDCSVVFEIDVSGAGMVFVTPASGPRLFVAGTTDLFQIRSMAGSPRVLELQALVGASNGGRHIAVGDVDGNGTLDLLQAGGGQLSMNFGTAEMFMFTEDIGVDTRGYDGGMTLDLVTFRNGDLDGMAITQAPMDSESLVVFTHNPDGDGFEQSQIRGDFGAAPFELFAADLDGDPIDDLAFVSSGDIVLALTND